MWSLDCITSHYFLCVCMCLCMYSGTCRARKEFWIPWSCRCLGDSWLSWSAHDGAVIALHHRPFLQAPFHFRLLFWGHPPLFKFIYFVWEYGYQTFGDNLRSQSILSDLGFEDIVTIATKRFYSFSLSSPVLSHTLKKEEKGCLKLSSHSRHSSNALFSKIKVAVSLFYLKSGHWYNNQLQHSHVVEVPFCAVIDDSADRMLECPLEQCFIDKESDTNSVGP